jgi:hypothetical protein
MEASELIGLSKQSIYKKLKAKELQEYIIKKQGMIYIDEEGFNLIKDSLKANIDDLKDFKEDINGLNIKKINSTLNDEIASDTEILSMNLDIFTLLKRQLEEKDLQLNDKDMQIHELHKLVENSQILLKEKPQDIKLLEQHFQDLDYKIMNIKEHSIPQQKNSWHKLELILSSICIIICLLLLFFIFK